ncbi:hypothetical protein, partial [Corallococcus exiguus]|uniref:hypothetical protein n=1 Tax=Corallococcus exiguus TaxID=83462 RepID=UPI001C12FFDE
MISKKWERRLATLTHGDASPHAEAQRFELFPKQAGSRAVAGTAERPRGMRAVSTVRAWRTDGGSSRWDSWA